jgi:outer membrane lipoprotein SlyB
MTMYRARLAVILSTAATLAGCATPQPVVYREPSANAVAPRVERDLRFCRDAATRTVGINARDVVSPTAKAAGIGAAATVAGTLAAGVQDLARKARTAAAAGATGALVKTLFEWNEPDEVHEEYVERCMEDRGHHVLGWR